MNTERRTHQRVNLLPHNQLALPATAAAHPHPHPRGAPPVSGAARDRGCLAVVVISSRRVTVVIVIVMMVMVIAVVGAGYAAFARNSGDSEPLFGAELLLFQPFTTRFGVTGDARGG